MALSPVRIAIRLLLLLSGDSHFNILLVVCSVPLAASAIGVVVGVILVLVPTSGIVVGVLKLVLVLAIVVVVLIAAVAPIIVGGVLVSLFVISLILVAIIGLWLVISLVAWLFLLPSLISLGTWRENDLSLLVFTIEFLLVKFIALVILVQDHVAVVESFHSLLVWSHIILDRLLLEPSDNADQNISIKSGIVLLGLSERSSFPIRHLLNLADGFLEYSLSNFCQTCLLLHEVNFSEVCLGVDEIFNILDEVHLWMLVSKLLDVRAEAKSDDGGCLIAEDFDQSIVQELALFKRNEVD